MKTGRRWKCGGVGGMDTAGFFKCDPLKLYFGEMNLFLLFYFRLRRIVIPSEIPPWRKKNAPKTEK